MRQEGVGQPESGRHFCRARCFEVCGLPPLQGWGVQGASVWVPPWLEGRGSQVPLLPSGYLQPWAPLGQEAGVVCAASSADAEFFGAVGSAVPQDHVLSSFQPTHLWMCKKMESSVILGCFAEAPLSPCGHLLGVNGKGVTGSISPHPGCCHPLHGPALCFFCCYKRCHKSTLMHKALGVYLLTPLEHINRSENILLVIKNYCKCIIFNHYIILH